MLMFRGTQTEAQLRSQAREVISVKVVTMQASCFFEVTEVHTMCHFPFVKDPNGSRFNTPSPPSKYT
jgi:hypothetical protein